VSVFIVPNLKAPKLRKVQASDGRAVHRVALYECQFLRPPHAHARGTAKVERCVARGLDFFVGRPS
jgi:hypothetical protein